MQKVITTAGTAIRVQMCGVSWLGNLYINTVGHSLADLLAVFDDPAQTQSLTYDDDGRQTVYTGYTELLGLQKDIRTGMIQVCLGVPANTDR